MAEKLNLSHLSEEECDKILTVIQRDFNLREHERQRLEVGEDEFEDNGVAEQVKTNQRQHNEKHCIRCNSAFNFLFNKKLCCQSCRFHVCKDCSTWDGATKAWICTVCLKRRELKNQSCQWFYDHIQHRFKRFGGAKVVRSLYKRKVESDSENDSGYDPSTSVCSRDSSDKKLRPIKDCFNSDQLTTLEIHQHIEHLVEGLVGDALDNAHINKIYKHPEYRCIIRQTSRIISIIHDVCNLNAPWYQRMFHTYKGRLSEAITQLYCSLDVVINSNGIEVDSEVTPTSAHVALKQIVCEIVEEAMRLPSLQDSGNASGSSPTSSSLSHENDFEYDDNFDDEILSYEDMLATAVLNKVIEQYQKNEKSTEDTGTDTDDLQHSTETVIDNDAYMSEVDRQNVANNNPLKHCVDVGIQSDAPSELDAESIRPDSSIAGEESANDDFSWAKSPNDDPIAYVIEEHIEEITTETYDNQPHDVSGSPPGVNEPIVHKSQVVKEVTIPELEYIYSGLDFVQGHKVPFPELGMDIVDNVIDDSSEYDANSMVLTPMDSWEENWLFRKQKKAAAYGKIGHRHLGKYDEPICMLIPNPSDPTSAKIGVRDIDELSDLSEKNSVGSIEFSSSEESGDEEMTSFTPSHELDKRCDEIVSEFSQKDLEHTIDYYKESDKLHHTIKPSTRSVPKKLNSEQVDIPSKETQVLQDNIIPIKKTSLSIPRFSSSNKKKPSKALKFSSNPESLSTYSGKITRIFAQVEGSKPFDVAWFHDGILVNDGGRHQIYWLDDDKFYLDIFDTDLDDSGTYSCVAFNGHEEIWSNFDVKIRTSSRADHCPEFTSKLENKTAKEGSPLRVSCKVNGYPEPQVVFYLNNKKLCNDDTYLIDNLNFGDWTVEIKSVSDHHNGKITARARSKVGEVTCSSLITIVPDNCKTDLSMLTKRVNKAKKDVEVEAQDLLKTANRQAAASALRRTTGRALDVINSAGNKVNPSPSSILKDSNSSFAKPPKPGTIAEREHNKWLQADVSMPNNPYTLENVVKRRESLVSCISGAASGAKESHDVEISEDVPHKIDCGLKEIEPERYRRDYYINDSPVAATRNSTAAPKPMPRKRNILQFASSSENDSKTNDKLNVVEEKVYLSAGKVFSLENRIKQLESQVDCVNSNSNLNNMTELEDKVALAVAQVTQNDKSVSRVEEEVARIKKEILQESTQNLNNELCKNEIEVSADYINCNSRENMDENIPMLPSVKALASKFKSTEDVESKEIIKCINTKKENKTEKDVILVEKSSSNYIISNEDKMKAKQLPDYKVHSLTARMVSKQFRSQVLVTNNKQSVRTSCIPQTNNNRPSSPTANSTNSLDSSDSRMTSPSPSENFQHGYTSDESTTSSNSFTNIDKPRRNKARQISNRATYWERRAEQGLLSDCSVNDEFPRINNVPE